MAKRLYPPVQFEQPQLPAEFLPVPEPAVGDLGVVTAPHFPSGDIANPVANDAINGEQERQMYAARNPASDYGSRPTPSDSKTTPPQLDEQPEDAPATEQLDLFTAPAQTALEAAKTASEQMRLNANAKRIARGLPPLTQQSLDKSDQAAAGLFLIDKFGK